LGILEFNSHYVFAQRRTNINDLVGTMIQDKEEVARKEEREAIRKKIASAAAYPVIDLDEDVTA